TRRPVLCWEPPSSPLLDLRCKAQPMPARVGDQRPQRSPGAPSTLAMAEDRRPLIDEGVHALLLPFRGEGGLEQKALMTQTFGKWSLERAVDRFLRHLHRRRVVTDDRMRGF